MPLGRIKYCVGLSHVAGCEGAVETGGGLGEFDRRQLEKPGGGTDEFGGNVASATGAAHVVDGLPDGAKDSTFPVRAEVGNWRNASSIYRSSFDS